MMLGSRCMATGPCHRQEKTSHQGGSWQPHARCVAVLENPACGFSAGLPAGLAGLRDFCGKPCGKGVPRYLLWVYQRHPLLWGSKAGDGGRGMPRWVAFDASKAPLASRYRWHNCAGSVRGPSPAGDIFRWGARAWVMAIIKDSAWCGTRGPLPPPLPLPTAPRVSQSSHSRGPGGEEQEGMEGGGG